MPIYKTTDKSGNVLALVAADTKAAAMRHLALRNFTVTTCDATETAELMQSGVPFERAGAEPQPEPEAAASGE